MTNKEKFLQLVSGKDSEILGEIRQRKKNRAMLRESQQIAIKVLVRLDEIGWSQKKLAEVMGVSPQHITKIVSGKENLTIETQVKLQSTLNIPILASFYENRLADLGTLIYTVKKQLEVIADYSMQPPINFSRVGGDKNYKIGLFEENYQPLAV
jgi:transcriptional regulator with XRE-family HTH domain